MKKFFKKPLNVVSLILAVLGLIGMVVILCVPHGGTYKYTKKEDDKTYTQTITFKKDGLYSNTAIDGEWATDEDVKIGDYSISKGKLSYKVGAVSTEVGKVNAFRISSKIAGEEYVYKCAASITFFVIACVMLALGAAGMVYGAVAKPKRKRK